MRASALGHDGLTAIEAALGLPRISACMPPTVPVPRKGPCPGRKRAKAATATVKAAPRSRGRAYTGPRITVPAKDRQAFDTVRRFWADPDYDDAPRRAAHDQARAQLGGESPAYWRAVAEGTVDLTAEAFRTRFASHMSAAQLQAHAQRAVGEAFADKDVAIRVTPQNLAKILRDGRFKTQHETGKSKGYFNPTMRKGMERTQFGVDEQDYPDSQRPIYGYLSAADRPAGEHERDVLSGYGTVAVVLKPHVRARTTAMFGDSMGATNSGLPSPVDDPSWRSFTFPLRGEYFVPLQSLDRDPQSPDFQAKTFIEAQIHGGISTGDIDRVVFTGPPDPALAAQLSAKGVPFTIMQEQ